MKNGVLVRTISLKICVDIVKILCCLLNRRGFCDEKVQALESTRLLGVLLNCSHGTQEQSAHKFAVFQVP